MAEKALTGNYGPYYGSRSAQAQRKALGEEFANPMEIMAMRAEEISNRRWSPISAPYIEMAQSMMGESTSTGQEPALPTETGLEGGGAEPGATGLKGIYDESGLTERQAGKQLTQGVLHGFGLPGGKVPGQQMKQGPSRLIDALTTGGKFAATYAGLPLDPVLSTMVTAFKNLLKGAAVAAWPEKFAKEKELPDLNTISKERRALTTPTGAYYYGGRYDVNEPEMGSPASISRAQSRADYYGMSYSTPAVQEALRSYEGEEGAEFDNPDSGDYGWGGSEQGF